MEYPRPDTIRWRVHLRTPPAVVFDMLSSDRGRSAFWAEAAPEVDGVIRFRFANGMTHDAGVLESSPPDRFAVEYFGGSRAHFELADDGAGGTDLTMTESNVPEPNWIEHLPGWIPVLLALKAAADHGIDLRNRDPQRTWAQGYVDV